MTTDGAQQMGDYSSVEQFAHNVTQLEGLAALLIAVAKAELNRDSTGPSIEKYATTLLVEAMNHVGIDPDTEKRRRQSIFAALRGEPLGDKEALGIVDYILSQMVVKPKGALAERLARLPCLSMLDELKRVGQMPPEAHYLGSTWSRRLGPSKDRAGFGFFEWRDGADGIIYSKPASHAVRHSVTVQPLALDSESVLVLGVVEVKAYHRLKPGEPGRQIDKHLARLTRGVQTRGASGAVANNIGPDTLYFATWNSSGFDVLPAAEASFQIDCTGAGKREWIVQWTRPLPLLRWAIGPKPVASSRTRRNRFTAHVPYNEAELETFGNDIMRYTLGAMADQLDLPGQEWGWYLERLLDSIDPSLLTRTQLARRDKLLRWLREE